MIKLIIAGAVLIKNAPDHIVDKIKKDLFFKNPKYAKAMKMAKGRYTPTMDPYLYYYKMRGSSIIVPRGYMNTALQYLKGKKVKIIDRTVLPGVGTAIEWNATLRPYQDKAVTTVLKSRYGILDAATGGGKTVMGVSITVQRKTKTLIIVHSKELLYQWVDAFCKFTNLNKKDIGLIGDGHYKLADVTIGIINSVALKINQLSVREEMAKDRLKVRKAKEAGKNAVTKTKEQVEKIIEKHNANANVLRNEFGFVILDETHRALGDTWITVVNSLKPYAHLGLTATAFRNDSTLTKALFRIVGPKLHRVDRKVLEETGAVLIPDVFVIPTKYRFNGKAREKYSGMLSDLVQDDFRNDLITKEVFADYKKYGQTILVVSDRVAHCEELSEELNTYMDLNVTMLHGKMKAADRKKAVEALKNGKCNVAVATISLIGEGFDVPGLSSVFLTTPIKFSGRLLQTVGRILRPSEGAKPRVYDFRDILEEVLKYSGFARDRVYKKHRWTK